MFRVLYMFIILLKVAVLNYILDISIEHIHRNFLFIRFFVHRLLMKIDIMLLFFK